MSNNDAPAGGPGGPVTVPALAELPNRMRVHALARLIGRTSREVMAALAELGVEVRSAQSSVDRTAAEQVVAALSPAVGEPAPSDAEPVTTDAPDDDPAAPLVPLFAPPTPVFQPPTRPARSRRRAAAPEVPAGVDTSEGDTPSQDGPAAAAVEEPGPATVPVAEPEDDEDAAARRRRRRGRRGRGRGRGAEGDDADEGGENGGADAGTPTDQPDDESADGTDDSTEDAADDPGETDGESAGSRRRRRRRRRKGAGDDNGALADDVDPPNTVVRVRQPREQRSDDADGDGVQSVRGSTRLEAKRQRRRDGRDAGRRRVPILSESEFLARRESVDRSMVVRERGDRVEIAVLEDEILVEHFVATRGGAGESMVGNIYLGRVQNVLPSMEAAFVDIGRGRNAVLYAGEVDWDAAGLGGKARRIEQALSSGDSVLVQVTKDPIGHKGARLTTQISLAGRFLVYVPSGGAAGISRKLPDIERKRLKDMLKEIVPSEAGVIIRTASEGVSHEALERDVRRLQAQWEVVKGKAEQTGPSKPKAPVLLYEEPDLLIKVVRDQFNEDFSRLVVEGDDAWDTLQNYVGHVASELADRLHRHVGVKDVFAEYRIDEQLLKALDRKVWLPSGGTLVIDRTEAMTVIDVNTGKFTGSGGNLEETVTRNNLEAAEEVVRQLRLRDIGGIIVIDFIDMVLEANRDLVLRRLTECLSRDRTRHQVAEVTSLGLVQMTRKRVGGGLLEHFSTPCEHCRGRGVVVTAEPITEEKRPDAGRGDGRPEREPSGRRARGGRARRGDDEDRVGPDSGRDRRRAGRAEDEVDPGDASVDVGAPAAEPAARPTPAPPTVAVEAPVVEVPDPSAADAPVVDAPAVDGPVLDVPVTTAVPDTEPPAVPVGVEAVTHDSVADPVADAVEEVVVERSMAEQTGRADATGVDSAVTPDVDSAPGGAEGRQNGHARPPRQRRGRVTRTAGAPSATGGDAPTVAVVTVPAAPEDETIASVPAVVAAPQPAPAATRPRRGRRAASRPAGPPPATEGGGGVTTDTGAAADPSAGSGATGGDPV